MNIPHEWHNASTGDALLPPLLGTEFDAAGRIVVALNGLGLTVTGVVIVENEWTDLAPKAVHIVIVSVPKTEALMKAIDDFTCDSPDVRGRWWMEDDAGAAMTRLAFQVGK